MKKILYITTIPWGWIKQRPQFIPEYLSKYYEIDVYYKSSNLQGRKTLVNSVNTSIENLVIKSFRVIPFYSIPIVRRLKFDWINKVLVRFQLPSFDNYDIIWFTSPYLFKLYYTKKCKSKIVYDCMDDFLEFPNVKNDKFKRAKILREENYILQSANVVFCSAQYLAGKIADRSGIDKNKITIVNNAIELPSSIHESSILSDKCKKVINFLQNNKCLLYIGTIEKWFDFDLLISVLNECVDYHLVLLGPGKRNIPKHERIHYMGIVQHNEIFDIMSCAKALIMPFIIDELIKAVNPVKLYEYIFSGKPVIAPNYIETYKFSKYVKLYNTKEDFVNYINNIEEIERTINIDECINFVKKNTWENRVCMISNTLSKI